MASALCVRSVSVCCSNAGYLSRMRIATILAVLAALVAIFILALSSESPPSAPSTSRNLEESKDARRPSEPDLAARIALDSAVAGTLLSAFDDTDAIRRRARTRSLDQLISIRKNMAQELAPKIIAQPRG